MTFPNQGDTAMSDTGKTRETLDKFTDKLMAVVGEGVDEGYEAGYAAGYEDGYEVGTTGLIEAKA
jgi:flagellar biosynthesis/type III secretory pathway protein FliH